MATLVLALGAPRRLGVNSARADQAAQLAALHWWRSLKPGQLPEHVDVPADILAWGRLPLEDLAERLQIDPQGEALGHDWTLTRSPSVHLMLPSPPPSRWQVGQRSRPSISSRSLPRPWSTTRSAPCRSSTTRTSLRARAPT
ncbi:hypothetical protein [Piscinibacter sp.]|uniref:hypothetical protein n=1 Tax=Piscinibacter sp. TaxID=1903157 RepID=UPI002BB3AB3D|nr:hypothetical protein [Albitalea sp.]HUG21553.1 hypothetical protein [Albitalea sp.]